MRVTSTSYYNNIYGENNKLSQQLFDVNRQISSTQKIQYAHEDPNIFIDTLRLDDEITTLTQTKNSAQNAYKMSTQADTTIGDMVKLMESMKVKLIASANGTNSDSSLQAIAKDMRGIENNLLVLANASIGGQYLFSGTATTQKPIDENGIYRGNDQDQEAFLGSGIKQKYNISGSQLFLGDENDFNRTVTSNISQMSFNTTQSNHITASNTIDDLMGNTVAGSTASSHFYIQGTKHNGETFKSHVSFNPTDHVGDLLQKISDLYLPSQVDVTLNSSGQIQIKDKQRGSSKLDFHMVGAIDFDSTNGGDAADISDTTLYTPLQQGKIDNLQNGTTNFLNATDATPTMYIKEFTKSGLQPSNTLNTIEGVNYDRTQFAVNGAKLSSNVSQVIKSTNEYASASTKLLNVGTFSTNTLFTVEGTTVDGTAFTNTINLATDLLDENGNPSTLSDATYQQLLDAINMAITGTSTIQASYALGKTSLTYDGKITFEDTSHPTTQARLSIYDATSSNYAISTGSSLSFNANTALAVRDPKTDFFSQIDTIIKSVEQGKVNADGTDSVDPRNVGIQNAMSMLDDLSDHIIRMQTESGSYSQVLQTASERTDFLIMSSKSLQSDIIDTDVAEATLRLQQLNLNYQALLSGISKVSKLSLVDYL